ncbi:hypothetical protein F2Q69_00009711 [Brassica cretica]|uniref:LisH domain-containing protein n=1 Tax=Brassica cretica TaxID=69181 RepID=A0A8S9NX57_BRACR|nr:hypothetical protein F2Q69_00009711 [Brassica cretica]
MSQTNWEADKIFDYRKVLLLDFVWLGGRFVWLDVYIYDYLVKRDLKATAQAFQAEGKVSSDPVAIDAPGGFLFEWWSVFWDIFIARTNEKHSEVAASYIEVSFYICAKLQYSLYDPVWRQNSGSGSALASNNKAYEERVKMPTQRDSLDETAMKRFGDNVGQLLDPNHASMLKSAGASGQPAGQVLHGASGGISPQVQARNQQLSGSAMDIKSEINPVLTTPRTPVPEGSLIGIPGSNQGSNLTLKGWPLTGFDQLRSGLLQQQKPFMQSPQSFHQLNMLSPQHQQQLMMAQQNLNSQTVNEENRRLKMLLNNRSMSLGKDGLVSSVGDVLPNVGSSLQPGGTLLPRGDTDMLLKLKMALLQQQHQQQGGGNLPQPQSLNQHSLSNQQSHSSNHNIHQQDKLGGGGSITMDGSMSNSFRGNEQVLKNQTGRKRKQPVSSSGPANSTGTANTTGPSPGSAPSTPSTHTPGDAISMPNLPRSGSSKAITMFGTDGTATLTSPSNQLDDLICSCDTDGEIRYWSINNGSYTRVYKGGSTQLRFQPRVGKYLAASSANVVSVLDVETQACRHSLQGHANQINSVCWDPSGDFLASVSEDMVKVWTLGTGSEGECVHELSCNGNKFQSCVFHPTYPSLLVIGCYQSLELWNMSENKTMTLPAHEGLIASLAVSTATGLVASASHDKLVKLWK